MRAALLTVALACSSCSALKAGWARIEWVDGKVSPEVVCSCKVDGEGDVLCSCVGLHPGEPERDLLWKRERRRAAAGGET